MARDVSTLVLPGGQSRCIFSNVNSEYGFQVIPGDVEKLLLFFQGGGACFNDASTQRAAPCLSHLVLQPLVGIFDRDDPANPYRTYTIVHINYCSGDLHVGNVVRWYLDGAGQRVEQRGYANALSAVRWARSNVAANLKSLLVAGSSTGALGAQLWAATVLRTFRYETAAVLSDSALGIFPENAQGPLLSGFGVCKTSLLDALPELKGKCASQQLTMQDAFHAVASGHPRVAMASITSQQDSMQIQFYNGVCMADMIAEHISAAAFESKLTATLEAYNKHPNFVSYLISGDSNYFLPLKAFFATTLLGKKGLSSPGLPLATWLRGLPESAGQSISSQCISCTAALRAKTFAIQAASPPERAQDLPEEAADDGQIPSIEVKPPTTELPWWSALYYVALLLTAGVLSAGAAAEWCSAGSDANGEQKGSRATSSQFSQDM